MTLLFKKLALAIALGALVFSSSLEAAHLHTSYSAGKVSVSNETLKVEFDLNTGLYSGIDFDTGLDVFSEARFTLSPQNVKANKTTYTWKPEHITDSFGEGLRISITELSSTPLQPTLHITLYENLQSFISLGYSIKNTGNQTHPLGSIHLLSSGTLYRGHKIHSPQILQGKTNDKAGFLKKGLNIEKSSGLMLASKVGGNRQTLVVGGLKLKDLIRQINLSDQGNKIDIVIKPSQKAHIPAGQTLHRQESAYLTLNQPSSFRSIDGLMTDQDPEIYAYDIDQNWLQVLLCNNDDKEKVVSIPLSSQKEGALSLGLEAQKSYYLYDFWNRSFIGKFSGKQTLSRRLKPAQALVYSIHEVQRHPQFISTNRHVMQGLLDLSHIHWDRRTKTYQGKAKVIGGETFHITIATNGFKPTQIIVDQGKASFENQANGIATIKIDSAENQEITWTLNFSK